MVHLSFFLIRKYNFRIESFEAMNYAEMYVALVATDAASTHLGGERAIVSVWDDT